MKSNNQTIYDFTVKDAHGLDVRMEEYRGKVLLIVNTATQCGFTPQYEGLQQLYDKYRERGFEVLDFPCNQFLAQSPLDEQGIESFCTLNYHTTFRLFSKVKVNGEGAEPLFTFLKHSKGGLFSDDIKWNFTKFLVSREGAVVERFAPVVAPSAIEPKIEKLL